MTTIPSISHIVRADESESLDTVRPTGDRAEHFRDLLDHARDRQEQDEAANTATARRVPSRILHRSEPARAPRREHGSETAHTHHHPGVLGHHVPTPVERPAAPGLRAIGSESHDASADSTAPAVGIERDIPGGENLGDTVGIAPFGGGAPSASPTVVPGSSDDEPSVIAAPAATPVAEVDTTDLITEGGGRPVAFDTTTAPGDLGEAAAVDTDDSDAVAIDAGPGSTDAPAAAAELDRGAVDSGLPVTATSAEATAVPLLPHTPETAGRLRHTGPTPSGESAPVPATADDAPAVSGGTAASSAPATPDAARRSPRVMPETRANSTTETTMATTVVTAAVAPTPNTTPGGDFADSGRSASPKTPIIAVGAAHQQFEMRTTFAPVATDTAHVVAQPADPTEQVLGALLPLHTRDDGTYTMQLELHPHDLGRVQLTVELHKGVLSVHLSADRPEAHAALAAHLDHLRALLDERGVNTGRLDLTGHGASGHSDSFGTGAEARDRGNAHSTTSTHIGRRGGREDSRPDESNVRVIAPRSTSTDRRLDLQI